MSDRDQTRTLTALLERHYIKPGQAFPGGVFIPECGINGGVQTRADALYVGFTSTSGRILVGHEVKVSRADWRKELDSAGKADFWADNCHEWYIVAPGPDVVPVDEVPHHWGLMYPSSRTKTRMQVVRKSTTWPDRVPSWDAMRSILARLDTLRVQHDADVLQKAATVAREEAEAVAERERRRDDSVSLTPHQQQRLAVLDHIERSLGHEVTAGWLDDEVRPERAAAALSMAGHLDSLSLHRDRYSANALRRAGHALLEGLDHYEEVLTDLRRLTKPEDAQ